MINFALEAEELQRKDAYENFEQAKNQLFSIMLNASGFNKHEPRR